MVLENIVNRSKKIKIYPNNEQKLILKKLIGSYRYFYNKTIDFINKIPKEKKYVKVEEGNGKYILFDKEYIYVGRLGNYDMKFGFIPQYIIKDKKKIKINQTSLQTLRPKIKKDLPEWSKNVPSHLIDYAIKEASNAFISNIEKFKNTKKYFDLKFKNKKKSVRETIQIEKCYFSKEKNTFFRTLLGDHIKSSESFKNIKKCDSSLTYHRKLYTWYLNINFEKKIKSKIDKKEICAIDPGIRTFATVYSPNEVSQLGIDANKKIEKICKEIDIIQSKESKSNHEKKKILRKALHRKIKKIKNLRDELHWKIINYLTKRYNKIYLPKFEVKNMVKNLNHKISRQMNTLGFYIFQNRLESKCIEKGLKLITCTEEYTSKTCTNCGNVKNIKKLRVYNCSKCSMILDRDINGARNIYLKNES